MSLAESSENSDWLLDTIGGTRTTNLHPTLTVWPEQICGQDDEISGRSCACNTSYKLTQVTGRRAYSEAVVGE
jgi:hypothetical protein